MQSLGLVDVMAAIFNLGWEFFQLPIPGTSIPFFALLVAPVLFGFALTVLFSAFDITGGSSGSGERQSGRGSGKQYRLSRKRANDEK